MQFDLPENLSPELRHFLQEHRAIVEFNWDCC
jgi:hypothetical protein